MRKSLIITATLVLCTLLLFTGCVQDAKPAAANITPQGQLEVVLKEQKVEDLRNTIAVSAQGEKKLMPDVAYVSVGVLSMNAKLKNAQEENRTKVDAIYKALNDKGITKDNIRTAGYNVNPQYDYSSSKPKIVGYEVSNTIEITVNNIETVGDILDTSFAAGANNANSIRFELKDSTSAYNDALKIAIDKAKAKADIAATTAGVSIKGVITLNEGGSSNNSPVYYARDNAKPEAGAPPTQITAGELTVTASVTLVYEIQNK